MPYDPQTPAATYERPTGERAARLSRVCEELLDWTTSARRDLETEWDEAERGFYDLGKQRVSDDFVWDYLQLPKPLPRVDSHVNVEKPIILQLASVMCNEPMRVHVAPRDTEPEKAIIAIGAQACVDYWKDPAVLDFEKERERLTFFVLLRNLGYLHIGYNLYAGPPDPKRPGARLGEVFLRARDPKDVRRDPAAMDARDASFFLYDRIIPYSSLPKNLRPVADGTRRGSDILSSQPVPSVVDRIYGPDYGDAVGKGIRVRELHLKAGASFLEDERQMATEQDDNGLFVLYVGESNEPVSVGPQQHSEFPFYEARYAEDALHPVGVGIAAGLARKNVIVSDIYGANAAHQIFARKWRLMHPENADIEGRFAPECVETIPYRQRPEEFKWDAPPPATESDFATADKFVGMARLESGATEVWSGESPENIGTATGLVIAKSGSEIRARQVSKHIRGAFKYAVGGLLCIAARKYVYARQLEVMGKSFPVRSMMVSGEGMDRMVVDIDDDPPLPSNPTLRIQFVVQLLSQVQPGTFDPAQIKEWLKLPQSETDLFQEDDLDTQNADEHAWMVLRGDAPPNLYSVIPDDNHEIHIKRKRMWIKTSIGKWARRNNPQGYKAIIEDITLRRLLVGRGLEMAARQGAALTPQVGGGTNSSTMGSGSQGGTAESILGKVSPAAYNEEVGGVMANRERVRGGVE